MGKDIGSESLPAVSTFVADGANVDVLASYYLSHADDTVVYEAERSSPLRQRLEERLF